MSPPSIVIRVVRPCLVVIEFEKTAIRTVCGNISSRFIPFLILINLLTVHPFIKGTAVVEHTVQDHFHAPAVNFFNQLNKKSVAGLQVCFVGYSFDVFRSMGIDRIPVLQSLATVAYDLSIVRINVIIILDIVFMVGR